MMGGLFRLLGAIGAGWLLAPKRRATDRWGPFIARGLWTLAAIAPLLALGGFLVVVSGIVPIKASSGHWPITRWFLQFAKTRSVSTHTLTIEAPPLEDHAMVLRGAGHYEGGCRGCHGRPGEPLPRIPHAMTPEPPDLMRSLGRWSPEELFYIVKHGIKFTGMPAWPTQRRDDEVWDVVAFLRRMPAMSPDAYERLVQAEATGVPGVASLAESASSSGVPVAVTTTCGRCHGIGGDGRGAGAFPRLAGQSAEYLANSLRAYASGERHSGMMGPIAAALDEGEVDGLARYYSDLPLAPPASAVDASLVSRGEAIASHGVPAQDIPSCADCHGPGASRRNPAYPRLDGQHPGYLVQQLRLLKEERRGGTKYVHLMHEVAPHLTETQMRQVAAYYASRR